MVSLTDIQPSNYLTIETSPFEAEQVAQGIENELDIPCEVLEFDELYYVVPEK